MFAYNLPTEHTFLRVVQPIGKYLVIHLNLAGLLAGAAAEVAGRRVPTRIAAADRLAPTVRIAPAGQTDPAGQPAPLAVVAANRVVDTCAAAAAAGVEPGMTSRHAQQICPALKAVAASSIPAPLVTARMAAMGRQAYQLSPRVEPDPPLSLYFDLRARRGTPASTFWSAAGLRAVLAPLARALVPVLGHQLRIGVAANRLLARVATDLLADHTLGRRVVATTANTLGRLGPDADLPAKVLVVPPHAGIHLLAPLPVERLWPLAGPTVQRLKDLGLYTSGAVAAVGLSALQAVLGGAEGLWVAQLAAGCDPTPVAVADKAFAVPARATDDLLAGTQISLWPPQGSLAGLRLGVGRSPGAVRVLGTQVGRDGETGRQRDLPKLIQGLQHKFPGSVVRLGGDWGSRIREQKLSYWDPWRVAIQIATTPPSEDTQGVQNS